MESILFAIAGETKWISHWCIMLLQRSQERRNRPLWRSFIGVHEIRICRIQVWISIIAASRFWILVHRSYWVCNVVWISHHGEAMRSRALTQSHESKKQRKERIWECLTSECATLIELCVKCAIYTRLIRCIISKLHTSTVNQNYS